jgi:hypothetical protein
LKSAQSHNIYLSPLNEKQKEIRAKISSLPLLATASTISSEPVFLYGKYPNNELGS